MVLSHASRDEFQGRHIFKAALDDGSVESFFPLVQHFTTQNEPASCALGTLCMVRILGRRHLARRIRLCSGAGVLVSKHTVILLCVQVLNALAIDPGQSWKGVWRWWDEEVRV